MKKIAGKLTLGLLWLGAFPPLVLFNIINARSVKEGLVRSNPWEEKRR